VLEMDSYQGLVRSREEDSRQAGMRIDERIGVSSCPC
jgi:hypothetical protein